MATEAGLIVLDMLNLMCNIYRVGGKGFLRVCLTPTGPLTDWLSAF